MSATILDEKTRDAALKTPALVSGPSFVLWGDQNVRIAFADQPGLDLPANWHTHVMMTPSGARALEDLLRTMRERAEQMQIGEKPAGRAN